MTSNKILFSKTSGPFGFLSNFYTLPKPLIGPDGKEYQTSESLFQTFKFVGRNNKVEEYQELIRRTDGPGKAACLGRQKINLRFGKNWRVHRQNKKGKAIPGQDHRLLNEVIAAYKAEVILRPDWDEVKVGLMRSVIQAKFDQFPELTEQLVSLPSNTEFVEHTRRDSFWGDGGNEKGLNHLGKIITEVINAKRKKLFSTPPSPQQTEQVAVRKERSHQIFSLFKNSFKSQEAMEYYENGGTGNKASLLDFVLENFVIPDEFRQFEGKKFVKGVLLAYHSEILSLKTCNLKDWKKCLRCDDFGHLKDDCPMLKKNNDSYPSPF